MSFANDLRGVFTRSGNGLMRIIVINAIVFIVVNILDEFLKFSGNNFSLVYWLALPGQTSFALTHIWALVTYMFLHKDFFHILFNMLWLYWLGKIFVEYAGSKRLVAVYLMGGISGGILYLLVSLIFPQYFHNSLLLGASAGVMAVVVAIAILLPDYTIHLLFFGPVRLKYLALISFILTSVLDISQNTGGKISHIGGALFGAIYMLQYKNGRDISKPVTNLLDWLSNIFREGRR